MTPERHLLAKKLFLDVCRRPASVRRALLEKACGDDDELKREVESLLLHHDSPSSLMPGETLDSSDGDARLRQSAPVTIGNYRVVRKLGEGGMGVVCECEQDSPVRRRVAVKLIKRGMDTNEVVARFETERQALALMNHPCIATVFDAGATDEGRPYFAMEYVPGEPVTSYSDRHRLSVRERLALFLPVCEAVQHAHHKGIIHRDIKPSNILVTIVDDKPVPKIIDFGVAKATSRPSSVGTVHTRLGQWVGTPEYMSPEQMDSSCVDIDTRTDVYSLGVVLYELLVGAHPFESAELGKRGLDEMRRWVMEEAPERPSTVATLLGDTFVTVARDRRTTPAALMRELRGDLDWITMKALEKDRTRRYGSPAELATDIERHLQNQPVLAGPPSTIYQTCKFIRRHRTVVAAGGLILATLLIGIAGTTLALLRAEREADSARQVSDVLQDIFEEQNPHLRRYVTSNPEEVLDRGVGRVESLLEGHPLVQARLFRAMGYSYLELGLYEHARPLFEKSIAIHREQLGEEHKEFALSISFLADLLTEVGGYAEAQSLHEQALAVRRKALGPSDLTVAWSLRSLATLHWITSDYDRARSLYRQALDIGTSALGQDDEDVAITLDYQGQLELETGDYHAARSALERAIEIRTKSLGPEHVHVAFSLMGLARLFFVTGEYERSQSSCERAAAILDKAFDADHPAVAYPLNQLASLHAQRGDHQQAQQLHERALQIREGSLGSDHVEVAESLAGLGSVHLALGDFRASRSLLERALLILSISTEPPRGARGAGRSAPRTSVKLLRVRILNSLGVLMSRTRQLEDAASFHELAIEVLETAFRPNHPELVPPLEDLGNLLVETGSQEAGRTLLRRAAEIRDGLGDQNENY